MRTYASSEDVQGATVLLPRSLDTISRPHLQCTISTPKGAFLAELPILAFRQIHTQHISFTSYRVPIYTPGWRAAMWIKCLAEGQKCQALTGIEPGTLWSRVKGSLQYTTAPPRQLWIRMSCRFFFPVFFSLMFFFYCFVILWLLLPTLWFYDHCCHIIFSSIKTEL